MLFILSIVTKVDDSLQMEFGTLSGFQFSGLISSTEEDGSRKSANVKR